MDGGGPWWVFLVVAVGNSCVWWQECSCVRFNLLNNFVLYFHLNRSKRTLMLHRRTKLLIKSCSLLFKSCCRIRKVASVAG